MSPIPCMPTIIRVCCARRKLLWTGYSGSLNRGRPSEQFWNPKKELRPRHEITCFNRVSAGVLALGNLSPLPHDINHRPPQVDRRDEKTSTCHHCDRVHTNHLITTELPCAQPRSRRTKITTLLPPGRRLTWTCGSERTLRRLSGPSVGF